MVGLLVFLVVVSLIGLGQCFEREWDSFKDMPPKLQLVLKVLGIAFGLIVLIGLPKFIGLCRVVVVIAIAVVIVVRIKERGDR